MSEGAIFCGGPVWDWDLSWNTERPRLTPCFRRLLLTAIPCSLLWLTTLLDVWRRTDLKSAPSRWTLLAVCKQATTWLLILCAASEGAYSLYRPGSDSRIEYLSVCTRLLTYVLALFLQIRQRCLGRLSSVKLTLFWTLMSVSEPFASPLYDILTDEVSADSDSVLFSLGVLSLSLVLSEAAFCHFTDPQHDLLFPDPKTDEYLTDHRAPLSTLLFSWLDGFMSYGYKNLLTVEDLPALRPDVRTDQVGQLFLQSWNRQTERRQPSLFCALCRALWPWMLPAALLELLNVLASLFSPIVLDWLIQYMEDSSEPWWHGPVYALLLFGTAVLSSLLIVHLQNLLIRTSVVPRSGINAAIYRKVFRLSAESRRGYSLGELCNLLTVDTQRIFELTWSVNSVWADPLRMLLTLVLLWRYLGVACLTGVAAMIALLPLTGLLAVYTHRIQRNQMIWKDGRLRLMNEMLNGIKVLKLFAWEPAFVRRVREVRELETNALKRLAFLNGAVAFLWMLAPFLVALCSFVTFVLLDERNVLDPSVAFVSLTLFGKLRGAMSSLPQVVTELVQSRISFRRVEEFLLCEEQETRDRREQPTAPGRVLEAEEANFSWGREGAFLRQLTFCVERGDLVAVVGRVGSGKSALLSAILGEMTCVGGSFRMQKDLRVAYVPQSAWIQNATLRQNVLFVSPTDKRKYDSVIRKCCLLPDLRTLPGGDHTEIGEKGVNLSGGQKQRVSLARAVYHEADLYLMDDPLSAVDAHVSRDIFADVIGPDSLMAHKTRILVTHDLSVLPRCDVVLLMSGGRISESGSYPELMRREGGELRRMVEEFAREKGSGWEADASPSPDPSRLTTEELKAQMRRIGQRLSRTMSDESDHPPPTRRFVDVERMEVGRVRVGVYCTYFRSAGLGLTTLVAFGFAAHQAFEIGSSVWLSAWSSDAPLPDGSQDVPKRNLRMIVYGALGFAQGTCVLLATAVLALASTRASIRLHRSMLWKVMRSPLSFFETTPLGRILNRFGKDVQGVDTAVPSGLSNVLTIVSAAVGTVALICANHPVFVLVVLPLACLYVFLQLFYMSTSRQLRRLQSVTLSPVLSFFSESVQGSGTVRAFGCREAFVRRHHAMLDHNCRVFLTNTRVNRWLSVRLQLMGAVIVLVVALLFVFRRLDYSAALVGLTLSYSLNVTDILGKMVRMVTQLETRMVSVERVDEYSRLEEEASWSSGHCPSSEWPSEGRVVFRGYKMSYRPGSEPVLKGIDLEIPGGQKVGVVGRTGAGKSSLAQALFRTVEASDGHLFVDGVDVAALGLHTLRSRITVIPQDPVLFGGDLRLNLDPEGRHTDREILEALEMARIRTAEGGLDRRLEEGGQNLSVGERQQVCLARALLQRSKILVLDEATAAVDLETDRLIQDTLRDQFRDCTVITVAHRLHTVLDYDRILVMEDGRIVEDGPPDVLLKRNKSLFRKLAHSAGLL